MVQESETGGKGNRATTHTRRKFLGVLGVGAVASGIAWKTGLLDNKDPYIFNLYKEVQAIKKGGEYPTILSHSQTAHYDTLSAAWTEAYLLDRVEKESVYKTLRNMNLLPATERVPAMARVLYHVAHSPKRKEAADFITDIVTFCPDAARIRFIGNPDGTDGTPLSITELLKVGRSFNEAKYSIPKWDEAEVNDLQQRITDAVLAHERLGNGSPELTR